MDGLTLLRKLRERGYQLSSPVEIAVGYAYRTPRDAEDFKHLSMSLYSEESVKLIDLRPFVGLDVIVFAERLTPQVRELFLELRKYSASVIVAVVELGEKIGWMWDAEKGTRAF